MTRPCARPRESNAARLWESIVEDYKNWQKRFAEICREVIVPELKRMIDSKELICRVNGAPCNECIPGAPCAKMAGGKR